MGFVLVLGVLGFGLTLVAPTVAAAPTASVEVVGDTTPEEQVKPLEVKPLEANPTRAGTLTVPLLVNSGGPLSVSFTDLATGRPVPISPPPGSAAEPDQEPPKTLTISGTVPTQPLLAREIFILQLQLAAPEEEFAKLQGVLSVRTGEGSPLAREVKTGPSATGWRPTQSKVEISATRLFFGASIPDASRTIGVAGSGSPGETGPLREAVLSFSDSGNGRLTIDVPYAADDGGSVARAKLEVSDVSGAGTATSIIDFGSEAKPNQQLEVVVKAGDSVWMPLVVILIGALFGKILPTLWDVRRKGGFLRDKLRKASDAYDAARAKDPMVRIGPLGIEDQVGPHESWPRRLRLAGWATLWGLGGLKDPENKSVEAVYYRLGHTNYSWKLEQEAEAATALVDLMEGWSAVRQALIALDAALVKAKGKIGELPPGDPTNRPLQDSGDLLTRPFKIDSDADKSAKLAKAIAFQTTALETFAEIESVLTELVDDEIELDELVAIEAYLRAKPPLLRSDKKAEILIEQLREILYRARYLREVTREKPVAELRTAELNLEAARLAISPGDLFAGLVEVFAPTKAPSTEQVMAEVRRGDWLIAIATLLVSSLAYLLPVYSGAPFGTCLQYLTAFVAGAGAQVAINGALIPFARSYKAEDTEVKDEGGGSTPAAAPA
ncbi:MAG TPA: hypothetical protein VMS11_00350 [Solirubrobacterales bacterium]|nr:hypothetical protein [Solirubrobacterales bacterium]